MDDTNSSSPPPAALLEAYHRTTYRVDAPGGSIPLRIGVEDARLDRLLEYLDVETWAFITAYNPGSRPRAAAENEHALARLREDLRAMGYRIIPAEGAGDDPGWPPEPSFFVPGMAAGAARELGRRYGQVAVVWGRHHAAPELLLC